MSPKSNRRAVLRSIGVAGAAGVAGCLGGFDGAGGDDGSTDGEGSTTAGPTETTAESTGTTTTAESTGTTTTAGPTQIGMVYALGGLGDKSFNDMANRGIKEARLDYGLQFQNATPESPDAFSTLQREYAEATDPGIDLVSCIGFLQADPLSKVAPEYPDQRFMIVDGVVGSDNVASYVFREEEGSFQVGHLAGLLTDRDFTAGGGETRPDTRTVGFVGGLEVPLIKKFEAGYAAGVEHAAGNTEVEVLRRYAGSFNDAETGEQLANELYDEGADIVYHAAGGTGIGVFEAAQSRGRYAIGVDADQSRSDPRYANVILASMVKRVDTAVYRAAESVVKDTYQGGETVLLGLEENGVSAVFGAQLAPEIPDAVKGKLSESRRAIVDGRIDVPTEPEDGGGS